MGKFSELSATVAHYLSLLEEADETYPELMQYITETLRLPMIVNTTVNVTDE